MLFRSYLCRSQQLDIIHYGTRLNKGINVLKCRSCGLVQLDSIMQNPDKFYQQSGMRRSQEQDVLKIRIAAESDDERRFIAMKSKIANKRVLDFGCGAGGFIRKASKVCSEVLGIELETRMRSLLNQEGYKCMGSLQEALGNDNTGIFDVITFFHVIEHLPDPVAILGGVRQLLSKDGVIVIEVPNCDDALLSLYCCNAFADFTYWESHLFLYNNSTLTMMIERAGYRVNFIRQVQRYPLFNTLFWLSKGKPGGHVKWNMMNDSLLDDVYGDLLARLGLADTIIAEIEPIR